VVLAVAALALVGVYGERYLDVRAQEQRRTEVLQQARQIGVNFVTLDYRTFDDDVDLVLDGATGSFRDSFRAGVEQTRELVTQNQSVSTGKVTEAALVSSDEDSAQVLLVVDTEVTNTANPEPAARNYRVQLDLSRVADRWLASDLQFVG
jgi:Mce-associated membrane protein